MGWLIFNSKREQNVNKSITCPHSYLAVPSCHQGLLITLLLKVTADPSVTRKQKHINIKETHQHAMLNIFQTANTEFVFCGCVTATSIWVLKEASTYSHMYFAGGLTWHRAFFQRDLKTSISRVDTQLLYLHIEVGGFLPTDSQCDTAARWTLKSSPACKFVNTYRNYSTTKATLSQKFLLEKLLMAWWLWQQF